MALWLAKEYHLGTAAVAVGIVASLPGLYLAWLAVRGDEDLAPDPGKLADDLAALVGRQWEEEAAQRRLNDPFPLAVCWAAADSDLADDWDTLVNLARSGVGWPPASPGNWAGGPGELAGCGDQIAAVVAKVPTRRLVVLGEPGSGKTMLVVRLVLDLLADRVQGGPVPVLVSLASWSPEVQALHDWLADRLAVDYPSLAAARSRSAQESPLARLLGARLITPVLDGLDEMPKDRRVRAIEAISEALRPGEAVVVTCRTADYRAVVLPPGGSGITVRGAAVVTLQPPEAATVSDYLVRDSGAAASDRWLPVVAAMGTCAPVSEVLSTPLMVGLARSIYSPRSGERADQLPDPAELCQTPDRESIQAHLFDAFIGAAYRYRPGARWRAEEAGPWLAFLARHLENNVQSPDFAWWQLRRAVRRGIVPPALGLAAVLIVALVAMPVCVLAVWLAFWHDGSLSALLAGLLGGWSSGSSSDFRPASLPGFYLWLAGLPQSLLSLCGSGHATSLSGSAPPVRPCSSAC